MANIMRCFAKNRYQWILGMRKLSRYNHRKQSTSKAVEIHTARNCRAASGCIQRHFRGFPTQFGLPNFMYSSYLPTTLRLRVYSRRSRGTMQSSASFSSTKHQLSESERPAGHPWGGLIDDTSTDRRRQSHSQSITEPYWLHVAATAPQREVEIGGRRKG